MADQQYISAGCFLIRQAESGVPLELWSLPDLRQWHHISPGTPAEWPDRDRILPAEAQQLLLASKPLAPFYGLLRALWIRCSFAVSPDDGQQGILRVYLLPDDVARRTVERSSPALRKARRVLLSQLDFSRSTWHGRVGINDPPPLMGDRPSLLRLFNSIPSPDPRLDSLDDPDARHSARSLMDSRVPGLTTDLYPYQRRSAALMLQREAQPDRVLDPRLARSVDQDGHPWYYDPANGVALLAPRHYDGVCGGILAEEMGAGKTLICLALILATRHLPSRTPDLYLGTQSATRPAVASLADMAAACITRNAVPWKLWFGSGRDDDGDDGFEYAQCIEAIRRNPAYYVIPPPSRRKSGRLGSDDTAPKRVYLSYATLVVVPPNLVQQWKDEMAKHTSGLRALVRVGREGLPPVEQLLDYDIILFSSTRFERLWLDAAPETNGYKNVSDAPALSLEQMHFKRCIVDEGHRFGNSTLHSRSNLLLAIDRLHISARWIVTGTPSKGLFGVSDIPAPLLTPVGSPPASSHVSSPPGSPNSAHGLAELSSKQEKDDIRRIGAIAAHYLKARPWANTTAEPGDVPADWSVYVVQPKYHPFHRDASAPPDCLAATLNSLIVRHRVSDIALMLPDVHEKVVYLDGSYQDRMSLNLLSMMIICNAVQSERKDRDYFFHPSQRKSLIQLVSNLRQATFFGTSSLSLRDIETTVDTAVKFLDERRVHISPDDEAALRDAIAFGRLAAGNHLRKLANTFHEIPVYVRNFPGGLGSAWSLDRRGGDPVCMSAHQLAALQKFLQPAVDAPHSLQRLFASGEFEARGAAEREKALGESGSAEGEANGSGGSNGTLPSPAVVVLAGNTQMGRDDKSSSLGSLARLEKAPPPPPPTETEIDIAEPLASTQITSTASAKLSYLIDQVVRYQQDEQIIIFYENDNVAYYVSSILDVLQIQHLIYSKLISTARRARYVASFNHNPKFRVLLMEIGQAAFGLDMRSASRIYFISPVLNPQVEAQAIGRARRVSQERPVTVETLVLRGSLEEVIVRRRHEMSRAEQRRCKSILDDQPIYQWILDAKILHMGNECDDDGPAQTAALESPQFVFGRGFGRDVDPDEDIVVLPESSETPGTTAAGTRSTRVAAAAEGPATNGNVKEVIFAKTQDGATPPPSLNRGKKRRALVPESSTVSSASDEAGGATERPSRRVRFG